MSEIVRQKGPWTYRLLVWGATVALAVLCFWLLGFVLVDIGTWPGPDYEQFERKMLDQGLVAEAEGLEKEIAETHRDIERDTKRQQVLRDSTQEAQRTMNQLLDFQRLGIEKGVTPSAEEQQALAASQRTFLDNQQRYQELNQQIAKHEERRDVLEGKQREAQTRLDAARKPIQAEFNGLSEQHRWKMAALKLGVLLPLLLVAVALFLKWRNAIYAPAIYAFGAAVVVRVGLVMHEYFPTRSFKYILIVVTLLVVLRVLVYLVRLVAYPKRDWLLRQYREAYERFLCPVCEYPIRRGPLKYLFWTRRTAKRLPQLATASSAEEEAYTCPTCATRLYEECSSCHAQRHTLLPACQHCGATRPLDDILSNGKTGRLHREPS